MASIVVRQHRRPPPAPTILAGIAFVLLAAGCDDGMGPRLEPGNVDVLLNAVVEETDTAVIVNGTPMIRYPSHDAALWIGRTESFDFGGFPEHGLPDSGRRALYWTLMLTHEYPRVVKGDSN